MESSLSFVVKRRYLAGTDCLMYISLNFVVKRGDMDVTVSFVYILSVL